MALDTRWKNPQGSDPTQLHLWAQDLIRELRKGDYLAGVANSDTIAYQTVVEGGGGSEGGELRLEVPASGSTLNGDVAFDIFGNLLRVFESGGTARGFHVDLTRCAAGVGTNLFTHSLIAAAQVTNQATIDIPVDGDTWDEVEIHLWNLRPATDNVILRALFSQSGSFLTGASDYRWGWGRTSDDELDLADSEIEMNNATGNATTDLSHMTVTLLRPTAASFRKAILWRGTNAITDDNLRDISGAGWLLANTNAIEDIRFLFSSGNIAEAYYRAVGKKFA